MWLQGGDTMTEKFLDAPLRITIREQMGRTERLRAQLKNIRLRYIRALQHGSDQEAKVAVSELNEAIRALAEAEKELRKASVAAGVPPPVPPAAGSGGPGNTTPASNPKPEKTMEAAIEKKEEAKEEAKEGRICARCPRPLRITNRNPLGLCRGCIKEFNWRSAGDPWSSRLKEWVDAGKPRIDRLGWGPVTYRPTAKKAEPAKGFTEAQRKAVTENLKKARAAKKTMRVAGETPTGVAALRERIRLGLEAKKALRRLRREAYDNFRKARAALRAIERR